MAGFPVGYSKTPCRILWEERKPTFNIPPPGHCYPGGPTAAYLDRVRVAGASALLRGMHDAIVSGRIPDMSGSAISRGDGQ